MTENTAYERPPIPQENEVWAVAFAYIELMAVHLHNAGAFNVHCVVDDLRKIAALPYSPWMAHALEDRANHLENALRNTSSS